MGDKTEAPTPRRRREARERGEVARSPEVNNALLLLIAFMLLRSAGPGMSARLVSMSTDLLGSASWGIESPEMLRGAALRLFVPLATAMAPFMLVLLFAGVLASASQVGLMVTVSALEPKWHRVNPMSGFKRLFSGRAVVDLAKACAKIALVGFVAYSVVKGRVPVLAQLSSMEPDAGVAITWTLATDVGTRVGLVMLILALADYIYQRRQHEQSLKMSRQEVIEEMKRYENPQIRQRIRQQQRRMAMRRMMASVPKADVVITNPTHLAVALKYDAQTMRAPQVVAKGQRLTAERIRAIARENGVPVIERKPLARALFKMAEVGMEIPGDLYQAVAEILAFVYSLRSGKR
ncbi:MAG: flagellar biosynthesis protein FlhB [Anaerolineae bacterium]